MPRFPVSLISTCQGPRGGTCPRRTAPAGTGTHLGMDTHISPAADAAREQSRQVDGRFGEQPFNRASTVQLTAPSDAVTSEGYDPQDVDFGLDSVNRCVAWYERDDNRTHIDVTCNVGASDLMGIPELASDDPRFEEGAVMLRELLEDRYPSAYLNTHTDEWEIQFTAEREGQSNLTDIVQSAWNDPQGAVTFHNESDEGTYGAASLHRMFRDRARGSVIAESPGVEVEARDVDDLDAFHRHEAGRSAPLPSDADARQYARELSVDGPEIANLARHGWADAAGLDQELELAGPRTQLGRFRASQLRRWSSANNANVRRRWDLGR